MLCGEIYNRSIWFIVTTPEGTRSISRLITDIISYRYQSLLYEGLCPDVHFMSLVLRCCMLADACSFLRAILSTTFSSLSCTIRNIHAHSTHTSGKLSWPVLFVIIYKLILYAIKLYLSNITQAI